MYGEKNGKGKEYRNDGQEKSLLYDGEYVNGKRNGKGKIYYHFGRLLFDGEFLYDKTIKGKKYDMEEGYLEYDGEFLYDKKNGKGKRYDYLGHLIFEGEFLNGKEWNGNGYDKNGNIIYTLVNGKGNVKKYDENVDE